MPMMDTDEGDGWRNRVWQDEKIPAARRGPAVSLGPASDRRRLRALPTVRTTRGRRAAGPGRHAGRQGNDGTFRTFTAATTMQWQKPVQLQVDRQQSTLARYMDITAHIKREYG